MALKRCKECGKEMSTSAQACPHCGKRSLTFDRGTIRDIIVVGLLVWIVFEQFRTERPDPMESKIFSLAGEEIKTPVNYVRPEEKIPEQEVAFCEIITNYRKLYFNEYHKKKYPDQKKNLQSIFDERAAKLTEVLGAGDIQGWKGIIRTITVEHGDGAWLEINLPCNTRLESKDNQVIGVGTPLFESLMTFRERAPLSFSGNFFVVPTKSSDQPLAPFYEESSLTSAGSIDSPEFFFQFKDVWN